MTKIFILVVVCNLIAEQNIVPSDNEPFNFSSKIGDILPEQVNLREVMVDQLLSFALTWKTPGRLDENLISTKEAYRRLHNIKIKAPYYEYNDFSPLLLCHVAERITGKPYADLVNQYVFSKIDMSDTHVLVPENKWAKVTGTPNIYTNKPPLANDPKSNILDSGYVAGYFSTSDDMLNFMQALLQGGVLLDQVHLERLLRSANANQDKNGKLALHKANFGYVANSNTLETYVPPMFGGTIGIQGSTRQQTLGVNNIAGGDQFIGASTLFINPASTDILLAKKYEAEVNEKLRANWPKKQATIIAANEKLAAEGKPLLKVPSGPEVFQLVREITYYNVNGKKVTMQTIDSRKIVSLDELHNINEVFDNSILKLTFLSYVIKKLYPDRQFAIDEELHLGKGK